MRKATAGTGKKISLELGGKSPFVVFDSADLDSTVEGVVNAIYFNQGQVSEMITICFNGVPYRDALFTRGLATKNKQ